MTLDSPTAAAQINSTAVTPPNNRDVITHRQNAADVCPEGKLNLSEAAMSECMLGVKSQGLSRFKEFFKT